ncbi:MAG: decaprenyl-phosphate phosphoribosyltransferase [Nostocoides sp.]
MLLGLIQLARPRQWVKNILVGAAPFAAGVLFDPPVLRATVLAFVAFCLVSSATYAVNDVMDATLDAAHPTKRFRPVASGVLPPSVALGTSVVLAAGGLAVARTVGGPLLLTVLVYLVLTMSYSLALKHQPVVELALVAGGFILRAVAGGAATGVSLSQWFLIIAGFGSLLMVTGKRLSELAGSTGTPIRRSLTFYPDSYLRTVAGISAAVTITGYVLWASEVGVQHGRPLWTGISAVPFVIALLRYLLDANTGRAEAPEHTVLADPVLLGLGAAWIATYGLAVL